MTTRITWIFDKGSAPYPSTCKVCGAYNKALVGLTIIQPQEGMLLFCSECFTAFVHEQLDFAKVEKKESLDELVEALHKQVKLGAIQGEVIKNISDLSATLRESIDNAIAEFHSAMDHSPTGFSPADNGSDSSDYILEALKDV